MANITNEAARCIAEVTFNANPDTEFASRQPQSRFTGGAGASNPGYQLVDGPPDVGPGGSRFKEQSSSTLGQLSPQPSYGSSNAGRGGTMPSSREYGNGPAPVDEFGRPIDGLPMSMGANTMPALGASGSGGPPIQQLPLSAIQHSMRAPPHSPAGSDKFVPTHGGGPGSSSTVGSRSGFGPPSGSGAGSHLGRPTFHAPPPPPDLHPQQQQQQQQQHQQQQYQDPRGHNPQDSRGYNAAGQAQDPGSSRFNAYPQVAQGRSGATVERGLTLSLPIRSPSPAGPPGQQEEREADSPFVPPTSNTPNVNNAPSTSNAPPPSNAPSAFKLPPQQQMQRQGTQDSADMVLGSGAADLQRTTTLPPKLGFGGDFPEWSLGLEELGMGDDDAGKASVAEPVGIAEPETKEEKKDLPEPPPEEAEEPSPVSAVPRSLREQDSGSQSTTPITQTPTTYSNAQTPTAYTPTPTTSASNAEGPRIVHDHVVDNPSTRTTGNSGRFAMFPDKRKGTSQFSTDAGDSPAGSTLLPPRTKTSSHPGVDRTPSPYPEGVSPVPTPAEEKQSEILPVNIGSMISVSDEHLASPAPAGAGDGPTRSILVDPQHSRTDTMGSLGVGYGSNSTGPDGSMPKLRFAPRPPSPVTPSPVTPGNPAWASMDSLDRGGVGPSGTSGDRSPGGGPPGGTPGYMEAGSTQPSSSASKSDNRLSVITPLEVHKNRDSGSHPATREL